MPAVVPFIPLIAAGAAATGKAVGSYVSNRRSDAAARAQQSANTEALEYERTSEAARRTESHNAYLSYLQTYYPDHYANVVARETATNPGTLNPVPEARRVNPATLTPADFAGGTRSSPSTTLGPGAGDFARMGGPTPAPVPGGGRAGSLGGLAGSLGGLAGAPRLTAGEQPAAIAPTGLAGLGDYDWRRKLMQQPQAISGGR